MGWGDWGTYINNMTKNYFKMYLKSFTILKIMFPRHMCKNCLSCCPDTNQGSMNADRLVRTIPCCREKTRRGRNKRHSFRTGKVHGSRNVSGTKYGHWWPGLWRQSALRLTCWEVGIGCHSAHYPPSQDSSNPKSAIWPSVRINCTDLWEQNCIYRWCIQGEGWVEIRERAVEFKIPNLMKPKALIIVIWLCH